MKVEKIKCPQCEGKGLTTFMKMSRHDIRACRRTCLECKGTGSIFPWEMDEIRMAELEAKMKTSAKAAYQKPAYRFP